MVVNASEETSPGGLRAGDRAGGRTLQQASTVIWHDLECGSYAADLPLWRELASSAAAGRRDGSAARPRAPPHRQPCWTSAPAAAAWRSTWPATATA